MFLCLVITQAPVQTTIRTTNQTVTHYMTSLPQPTMLSTPKLTTTSTPKPTTTTPKSTTTSPTTLTPTTDTTTTAKSTTTTTLWSPTDVTTDTYQIPEGIFKKCVYIEHWNDQICKLIIFISLNILWCRKRRDLIIKLIQLFIAYTPCCLWKIVEETSFKSPT